MKPKYDRGKIVRMYKQGYTDQEIANAVGSSSWRTIDDLLVKLGVRNQKRETTLDVPKVRALAKAGWTVEEIEYEFAWRFGIEQIRDALAGI